MAGRVFGLTRGEGQKHKRYPSEDKVWAAQCRADGPRRLAPWLRLRAPFVVRLLVVAAVTVDVVPLNFTVLAPGVALKFWPWIVTVCPTLPCIGEKLKIASALGEVVERVIESRFPTAS